MSKKVSQRAGRRKRRLKEKLNTTFVSRLSSVRRGCGLMRTKVERNPKAYNKKKERRKTNYED